MVDIFGPGISHRWAIIICVNHCDSLDYLFDSLNYKTMEGGWKPIWYSLTKSSEIVDRKDYGVI
jgi:hypothetical protein